MEFTRDTAFTPRTLGGIALIPDSEYHEDRVSVLVTGVTHWTRVARTTGQGIYLSNGEYVTPEAVEAIRVQ